MIFWSNISVIPLTVIPPNTPVIVIPWGSITTWTIDGSENLREAPLYMSSTFDLIMRGLPTPTETEKKEKN